MSEMVFQHGISVLRGENEKMACSTIAVMAMDKMDGMLSLTDPC